MTIIELRSIFGFEWILIELCWIAATLFYGFIFLLLLSRNFNNVITHSKTNSNISKDKSSKIVINSDKIRSISTNN